MAQINLLKANYTGSIGNTTGVELAGQNVIKAKIWSKAPASNLQKNNVRAFEALNRVCGVMSRKWAQWLPVKKNNMLLHNALAKYFKDVVQNHTFNPNTFEQYADGTSTITINHCTYDQRTGELRLKVAGNLQDFDTGLEQWAIIVCDAKAHIMLFVNPRATEYETEQTVGCSDPSKIYVICFASSKKTGKTHFTACAVSPKPFDGTWYTSVTQSVITAVYDANTYKLILTTSGMYVQNNTLYTTVA